MNFDPSFSFPSPAHESPLPFAIKFPFRLSLHCIVPSVVVSVTGTNIFPAQDRPSMVFTEITASFPTFPLADPRRI